MNFSRPSEMIANGSLIVPKKHLKIARNFNAGTVVK